MCDSYKLLFFNSNGIRFTNFNAAFAAHAFIFIDYNGFFILKLKDFYRTYIYTFFTASTFSFINTWFETHFKNLLK